jgi:hypothetical protein
MFICLSRRPGPYLRDRRLFGRDWVSRLRGKIARFLAFLALIAGLLAPAMPGGALAAPIAPAAAHAVMDCAGGSHQKAPARHLPGAVDCCIAAVCAMNLALPATPTGLAPLPFAGRPDYDLRATPQPAGIEPAPIPHPPKSAA